jgi:DNA-directed RNA polymerase subunit RPC12/RpoP
MRYKCADCQSILVESEIEPVVGNLAQRILPGDTVPAGECRRCGAVVHPYGPQEEFVDHGGNRCPNCDSKNIMNHPVNSDCFGPGGARVETECHDCGKLWSELYKMTGFEMAEEEEEPCLPRRLKSKKRRKRK